MGFLTEVKKNWPMTLTPKGSSIEKSNNILYCFKVARCPQTWPCCYGNVSKKSGLEKMV